MNLGKIYKNVLLVLILGFVLSACATQTTKIDSQLQGDVYTGTETDASDPSWSSLLSN